MLETRILNTPPYEEDPRPISVPIDSDEMTRVVQDIIDHLEESRRYWNVQHDQMTSDRGLYKAHQTRANLPYPEASQLIVPMITYTHQNLLARSKRALFTPNPQFNLEGRDEMAKRFAPLTEDAIQRNIGPEYMDLAVKTVPVIDGAYQDGTNIAMIRWHQDLRTRKTTALVQRPVTNPYTGEPMIDPMTGGPALTQPQVETIVEQSPFYDNLDIVQFDKEQVDIWPPQAASIREARLVGFRMIKSFNEMYTEALQGDLDMERVIYLRNNHAGDAYEPTTGHKEKSMEGNSDSVTRDVTNRPYKLTECYYLYTPAGAPGPAQLYLITLHEDSKTVLRFRENPWWHGEVPAVEFSPLPGKFGISGRSVPDLLGDNQKMTSMIMQLLLDDLALKVRPPYATRHGMFSKPELELFRRKLSPGSVWQVTGDPRNLVPLMGEGANPQIGISFIDMLRQFGARVSAVDDPNMGGQSKAGTTATEIEAMLQEGEVMFTEMVDNLARSYLRLGRLIKMSMAQMAGHPTIQRVWGEAVAPDPTGMNVLMALWSDYDMEVAGSAASANAALRKRQILELYTLLMQNELTAMWLPRVHELTSLVLNEYNQRYPEKLIGTPEEAQMMQMMKMQAAIAVDQQQQQQQQQQGAAQANGKKGEG